MYCVQYKLEGECPYYQPARCDFTKYFYLQCYLVIIETLCTTKSVIYEIVWAKNVKTVFTLKQIYFSFPAQTAVSSDIHEMMKNKKFEYVDKEMLNWFCIGYRSSIYIQIWASRCCR